jgi:hypothetical protein
LIYISTSVLSQYNDQWTLHLIAFFSKIQLPAKESYKIYDQELCTIVTSLE